MLTPSDVGDSNESSVTKCHFGQKFELP